MLYTEQDLVDVRAQQKKRWLLLALPCALLLAVIIAAVVLRLEVLADAATIIAGALLIAGWDLLIKPLHCYEIHINNVLHGMTHDLECEFAGFDPDESLVDGVRYHAMHVTCYDEKDKPYDRMFYFDTEKEQPAFEPGQRISITYHDHEVGGITIL